MALQRIICLLFLAVVPITANLEGDALYALRRAADDPENVLQSWDPTLVDPCTWFHVTCDVDNRVTRLDLGNAKLSGKLVPELGKLERLQYLKKSLVGKWMILRYFIGHIEKSRNWRFC